MARDPSQAPPGGAFGPRQRTFGEAGGDDGWTLIGPEEDSPRAAPAPDPIEPTDVVEVVASAAAVEPLPPPLTDPPPQTEPEPQTEVEPFVEVVAAEALEVAPPSPSLPPRAAVRRGLSPVAVGALAAALLGLLAWRHVRVVRALESDLAAERERAAVLAGASDTLDETFAHLRAEVERLERELADVSRRAAEADALARREGSAQRQAEALAAERDGLRGELDAARAALGAAQEQAASNSSRLAALNAELERARATAPAPRLDAAARRADVCDRLLVRLEAGEGAAARAVLDAGIAAGLFAQGARDGTEFLGALASTAEALERARVERATSTAPAAGAVLAALEHARGARERLPALASQAEDWIERDGLGGALQPADARARRLERALESLEAQAQELGGDLRALHEADWSWIAARGALQDQALAHAHALEFACAHRAELAAQAAERLLEQCLVDGTPRPQDLSAAECLSAWAALLADAPSRSAAEDELLWLEAARRWYALEADAPGFAWHGLQPPLVEQRTRDWRAELWLRVRLAGPDSAWPPRRGEFSLYRLSGPSRARWRSDRCVEREAGGWTWLRTHLDEQGAALGEPAAVCVAREGERARLCEADVVLLDLRAAQPLCEVAPAPLPPTSAPPAVFAKAQAEWLARAADVSREACLLVRHGDTTRWFSPRLGWVLEERELPGGPARVELVLREEAP
jgi:hypothetical protein